MTLFLKASLLKCNVEALSNQKVFVSFELS
jgi:hypothetical protein